MINQTKVRYCRVPYPIQNETDARRLNVLLERIWRDQQIYQKYDLHISEGKSHHWCLDELSAVFDLARSHVDTILRKSGRKPVKKSNKILKATPAK